MNMNFNFVNNQAVQQEIYNICSNHPECKDCPFKTQDLNIGGSMIRCENKNKENK